MPFQEIQPYLLFSVTSICNAKENVLLKTVAEMISVGLPPTTSLSKTSKLFGPLPLNNKLLGIEWKDYLKQFLPSLSFYPQFRNYTVLSQDSIITSLGRRHTVSLV